MRVGTRSNTGNYNIPNKDHPHACGDKGVFKIIRLDGLGSSPCVWGQDAEGVSQLVALGIIPMRVGTSSNAVTKGVNHKDHPHACGDKVFISMNYT